jgi:hypothetical protein
MVGSISNIGSATSISSVQQPLTPETKSKLENLGIDTTNVKTEAQGKAILQSVQSSQQGQEAQNTQKPQKSHGNNNALQYLKAQAEALASKVGASISSDAKLNDIMDAISQRIAVLQSEAANDPQKMVQVTQYQAEYNSLSQSISSVQISEQSIAQAGTSQIQNSMNGMAIYNIASISISNNNTGNLHKS